MSRSRAIFLACALIVLALWIGLFLPVDSWSDILLRPWHMLWGTSLQLNATLLDASNSDSTHSIDHPLLKPSGTVKLLREVKPDSKTKS